MKLITVAAFATILCLPCFWLSEGKNWGRIHMPADQGKLSSVSSNKDVGTRWAVLVAGSSGYENYRHQADVCHAYQILKKGGLKDENIIVFMYDDIANNEQNPRPGVIINHPRGHDVYAGVPKDYTGQNVTAENFYAVLLGDKSLVKGGSGKVVASNSKDRIFVYYTDHGGPGVLGMPVGDLIYAKDFIEVLKKKHERKAYKEMVIYVEACESGSIFEGMLTEDLNIYVTTASNATEDSWATYCEPSEIRTCLGDLYSVAWLEDSETHISKEESMAQQYKRVKKRTSQNYTYRQGSHVMEYGNKSIKTEKRCLYQGDLPATDTQSSILPLDVEKGTVNQRDANILFLRNMYNSESNNLKKQEIAKEIFETIKHRSHLDASVKLIIKLIFGPNVDSSVLHSERGPGMPLVDNWDCLKSMVELFEKQCGPLTSYGLKYTRAFANMCNKGISLSTVEEACVATCGSHRTGR